MIKIILYKGNYWWAKIVHAVTGSWYYHVALWIDGWIYEETTYFDHNNKWVSGARRYFAPHPGGDHYVFKVPLSPQKIQQIQSIAIAKTQVHLPYNLPKFLAMWFIYPLRWLWKLIGWTPFSQACYGNICSTFVDEIFKIAGIDLLPGHREDYTAPGDFVKSPLLRKEP